MNYEVVITARAAGELHDSAAWWSQHRSQSEAQRWYEGILAAIHTLESHPQRCGAARESGEIAQDLRQLTFGLGVRPTHRAVFVITESSVVVLSVRHLARDSIDPTELT